MAALLSTVSHLLATVAVILVAAGLFFASDRRRHVPLMFAAFALDMTGLVLVEFITPLVAGTIDPVRSLTKSGVPTIVWVHAAMSTAFTVCYILQIVSGKRLLRADRGALGIHKSTAKVFVVTRLIAYVTMFFV